MKHCINLLLLVISIAAFAQDEDAYVLLKDATKQSWVKGSRSGVKFAIKIGVNTKLKTVFKNIWIGEENVPFDATLFNPNPENKINPGDSVLLTYNMVKDVLNDNSEAPKLPFKYKSAALVEVDIDGKAQYIIVASFRDLKD